jgi:hypothetical protein
MNNLLWLAMQKLKGWSRLIEKPIIHNDYLPDGVKLLIPLTGNGSAKISFPVRVFS